MESKVVVALATLTNTGGKRKADNADDDGATSLSLVKTKKLKAHNRTMSMEDAKKHIAESAAKLKAKEKIIRDRQNEIRELKKQLATADNSMTRAKNAKAKIESENAQARIMVQSDADLIMKKVEDAKSAYHAAEALGRDTMDDMISLGDEADTLRLADVICELAKASPIIGAIHSVMAAHKHQPSSTLTKALRTLYLKLLQVKDKHTDHKTWPLIASAMNIGMPGLQQDVCEKEYGLLVGVVLEAVEEMKKKNPLSYGGYYRPSEDVCPIIEILLPMYNAIEFEGGSAIKASFLEVMKKCLIESVNEVQLATNYAMPTEAEIAGKKKFPELQRFLLSPTETSLSLNLSKAGRMSVHRLIDNNMDYNKLTHSSQGGGYSRYLVVRKANAESPEMIQNKKDRKEKHVDMLVKFMPEIYHKFVITLPPPSTRVGLTLHTNTVLQLPELKDLAPNSPIRDQLPEKFHKDVCVASLKSETIGFVQPKTAQECATMIGNSQVDGPTAQGRQLQIVLVPLK